jgi:hypothetical protein
MVSLVTESNARAQKKFQEGSRTGEGVDCRQQPVGRTGQSARKIFSRVKRGEVREENRDGEV